MVLAGRVRIRFESGEVLDLARQESAYFDSGVGHVYLSTGRGDAQVLVVMAEG
jgi:mannose-6-phosphate isomerase-like protein (cupin superfamily)